MNQLKIKWAKVKELAFMEQEESSDNALYPLLLESIQFGDEEAFLKYSHLLKTKNQPIDLNIQNIERLFKFGTLKMVQVLNHEIINKNPDWISKALLCLLEREEINIEWQKIANWLSNQSSWNDKNLHVLWGDCSDNAFNKINVWMESGCSFLPQKWTYENQRKFVFWFSRVLIAQKSKNRDMGLFLKNFERFLKNLSTTSPASFQKLSGKSIVNEMFGYIQVIWGSNDLNSLFHNYFKKNTALPFLKLLLKYELYPDSLWELKEKNLKGSWAWKAAQAGDLTLFSFLLQEKDQLDLFKKNWDDENFHRFFFSNDVYSPDNKAIFILPICHQLGLNLNQNLKQMVVVFSEKSNQASQPLSFSDDWLNIWIDYYMELNDKQINPYQISLLEQLPPRFSVKIKDEVFDKESFLIFLEKEWFKKSLPKSSVKRSSNHL